MRRRQKDGIVVHRNEIGNEYFMTVHLLGYDSSMGRRSSDLPSLRDRCRVSTLLYS